MISDTQQSKTRWCYTGDPETRAHISYLRNDLNTPYKELEKRFQISRSTLYRISNCKKTAPKLSRVGGRPRKLTTRTARKLLRQMVKSRREGCFTVRRVMADAGIDQTKVSVRTVTRMLHSEGYRYLQARNIVCAGPQTATTIREAHEKGIFPSGMDERHCFLPRRS